MNHWVLHSEVPHPPPPQQTNVQIQVDNTHPVTHEFTYTCLKHVVLNKQNVFAAVKEACVWHTATWRFRMRLAGLTGGIACGKSTVTGMLREEQIPVIDSDVIAQEATQKVHGWQKQ